MQAAVARVVEVCALKSSDPAAAGLHSKARYAHKKQQPVIPSETVYPPRREESLDETSSAYITQQLITDQVALSDEGRKFRE